MFDLMLISDPFNPDWCAPRCDPELAEEHHREMERQINAENRQQAEDDIRLFLSMVADFIPVLEQGKGASELVTGEDPITEEEASRLWASIGMFGAFGGLLKSIKRFDAPSGPNSGSGAGGEASSRAAPGGRVDLDDVDLSRLSASDRRSVRSLNKRAQEHRQKLENYRRNPDAYDNQGHLANAPTEEIREQIIDGRIQHLENEIDVFESQIFDILQDGGVLD